MAVSEFYTWGLLNAWQRRMVEDIWRFNQILGTGVAQTSCEVYNQPDREIIADALYSAVQTFIEYAHYYPKPTWVVAERVPFGRGTPWQRQILHTKYGYLVEFGARATTLIQANATVVYSDSDGDGIDDTATITVTTTVDADEIEVFFRTADGAPGAADERWQIEPLTVTKSGNTATITGHRALFVDYNDVWNTPWTPPNFVNRYAGSTATAGDFVTAVDVYRVYADSTDAVQLLTDSWLDCCGSSDYSTFNSEDGVVQIVDSVNGSFRLRADSLTCWRQPELALISYRAGYPMSGGYMNRQLETALIRFANTLMGEDLCSYCDRTRSLWDNDRQAMPAELLTPNLIGNPFGIMRGQLEAWRIVRDKALGAGGKL
ncbi:MAG: hypothetical protein E6Q97_25080 [Desulfurellales bacterium]|nr:MAG: hypothetical protein E6Q97_25080 [Desulfurellales bacterium]